MAESKINLKKKIDQLNKEAYEREIKISGMSDHIKELTRYINDLQEENIRLLKVEQELMAKNKQLLQDNIEILERMQKILKESVGNG